LQAEKHQNGFSPFRFVNKKSRNRSFTISKLEKIEEKAESGSDENSEEFNVSPMKWPEQD